jgi:GT2 family glycosyltransferase/2-polyprenyl-3-methyl-5-hydroxy-6-metoxy-1,4-benzoquinol methylase
MDLESDCHEGTPAGILVLGAPGPGDLLVDYLVQAGLARPLPGHSLIELAREDERLVRAAGGTPEAPPFTGLRELEARLRALQAGAGQALRHAIGSIEPGAAPWVWWHPLNAFLADWWADVAQVPVAVLFAVGPPGPATGALAEKLGISTIEAEHHWFDLHRAALAACDHRRSMIVATTSLEEPKALAGELAQFLDLAEPLPETLHSFRPTPLPVGPPVELTPDTKVLWTFLQRLSNRENGVPAPADDGLVAALQGFYDEDYYDNHLGPPYRRGIEEWDLFFNSVAKRIASTIRPRTVLDAGCAIGFLVEKLRSLGVDASGFDISPFAIGRAPSELAPYLTVRSITEEIDGHYDLITCLEVVEHLPPRLADAAIANVCRHAESVLFSSSPEDFEELSHINVRPIDEWAQRFADHGFHRDFSYDATFVAAHAVLFRRGALSVKEVVGGYEQRLWRDAAENRAKVATAATQAQTASDEAAAALGAQADAQHALDEFRMRWDAERAAARDAIDEQNRFQTRLATVVEQREAEIEEWRREVERIHQTKIFRYSRGLRRIYGRLRRRGATAQEAPVRTDGEPPEFRGGGYELWVETYDTLTEQARNAFRQRIAAIDDPPVFSVLVPVYNTPEPFLRAAIDSVRRQLYPHWQLCLADDCSTDERVGPILAEYTAADPRISFVRRQENGHISVASNSALELATGSWVVLLDHDDELAEHALAVMALSIAEHPEVSYLYSDEDKLDDEGRRCSPFFKPDFDSVMLLGENYPCHLFVARRERVEAVGGFRTGFEGSQDWDLVLRITEGLERNAIRHVPHVLYHWRVHAESTAASGSAKPYAATAGVRAVEEHLARTGQKGEVTWNPATGRNRVRWDLGETRPLVSVIVPTRDGRSLNRCLDSVRRQTAYDNYEIIVIDNGSRTSPTLNYLQAHESFVRVIRDERPFNYSALNNAGVAQAGGELLLLLNDDVEVMGGEWLEEMVSQVMRPGIGIVGAKLIYPDGAIQHAGVTLGIHGVAGHLHNGVDRFDLGYFGDLALARQVSAVTGACMLVRREIWDNLGGLDESNLAIAFNDIDFCLRAREAGWLVIWTPFAELIHHESISRGRDDLGPRADEFGREVDYMKRRWAYALRHDPAYNPNLTLLTLDADLSWPPRVGSRSGDS